MMRRPSVLRLAAVAFFCSAFANAYESHTVYRPGLSDPGLSIFDVKRPDDCPPCFNCNLQDFQCHQFSNCTATTGRCSCVSGWGGEDCTTPLCGSLPSNDRPPREGATCDCDDGWSGINCNMCDRDDVCNAMVPGGEGGVCYKGGLVVRENFQQCKVTNKQILDQLKGQIPEVTFSCTNSTGECAFQCTSYHAFSGRNTDVCSLGRSERVFLLRPQRLYRRCGIPLRNQQPHALRLSRNPLQMRSGPNALW